MPTIRHSMPLPCTLCKIIRHNSCVLLLRQLIILSTLCFGKEQDGIICNKREKNSDAVIYLASGHRVNHSFLHAYMDYYDSFPHTVYNKHFYSIAVHSFTNGFHSGFKMFESAQWPLYDIASGWYKTVLAVEPAWFLCIWRFGSCKCDSITSSWIPMRLTKTESYWNNAFVLL